MTETLPAIERESRGATGLSGKRGLFVEYYTGNAPLEDERERMKYYLKATPSARAAGYKAPHVEGSRLLKDARVLNAVRDLLAEYDSHRGVAIRMMVQDATRTDDEILERAMELDGQAAQAATISAMFSARTTQRTNMLKVHGMFVEHVHHTGTVTMEHRVSDLARLSREERDELRRLQVKAQAIEAVGEVR